MTQCGGDSKGVDLRGFDKLVDVLVGMYADSNKSSKGEAGSAIMMKEGDFLLGDESGAAEEELVEVSQEFITLLIFYPFIYVLNRHSFIKPVKLNPKLYFRHTT